MDRCPFAFCGQEVRVDNLVVDGLFNKALRDTDPSVKEIELLDGSFKAVTSNETHRDVVYLDDDEPEIVDCQVPMESEVDPMLSVGTEVLESLHDALTSIDSKLEAHKLAFLSDVRTSFHDLRDFARQKFSAMQACEPSPVRLSVAKELHSRSTKVFQLAAKHLQKYQDSTNPERPRASASKQWLHDIAHATVALHSLIKERVLGAPKMTS
ncbi:hypothetical protein AAVH_19298 [Aphelenchoides avenae]|nr:hypothetical protein AAVH_19298 [Aphelenchus avenae]